MDLREMDWKGGDWMLLAQDRDQWWAVVNTLLGSKEVLSSMGFYSYI
jgi:hypothetical protein